MRIRWFPLAVALVATAVATAAAVGLGARFLPLLKSAFSQRGGASLIGAFIAVAGGVATALILALRSRER